MFIYPTLRRVETEKFRFYETPEGRLYPSMTTVLGHAQSKEKTEALERWANAIGHEKAAAQTTEAGRRGTVVHLLAERFLKGENLFQEGDAFQDSDVRAFNSIKSLLKLVEKPIGLEVALYSDLLHIAGTCDLVAIVNGELVIVDYKTSRSLKGQSRIDDYRVQLCGYAAMHDEMFGTDIRKGYLFMTSQDGFPQKFEINLLNEVNTLVDKVQLFFAANPELA